MSIAWMAPLPVWREPLWASVLRIAGRLVLAGVWAVGALRAPWWGLAVILWVFAGLSIAHAAIGVANRIKNHGVLLQLMGTGTLEWPQSLQEKWLRRPVDWVDGTAIEVLPVEPLPLKVPAAPHVTLVGATHELARLPLYRRTMAEFMDEANTIMASRGVALVEVGTVRKPRGRTD